MNGTLGRPAPVGLVVLTLFICSAAVLARPAQAKSVVFETKLSPTDATPNDQFGYSVAIWNNIAIVGAPAKNAAYLFDVTTGRAIGEIDARERERPILRSSGGHRGRQSPCRRGRPPLAASPYPTFVFDVATGNQLLELIPLQGSGGDQIGGSVSISGDRALVGTTTRTSLFGNRDPGFAYLFDLSSGMQIKQISAADGENGDRFGETVAIGESIAVVGARGDADAGRFTGATYFFDAATGTELAKFVPEGAAAGEESGRKVAVSGNTAIVTSVFDDNARGSAYVVDLASGQVLWKLTPSEISAIGAFGDAVAMDASLAVVGALYRLGAHGLHGGVVVRI